MNEIFVVILKIQLCKVFKGFRALRTCEEAWELEKKARRETAEKEVTEQIVLKSTIPQLPFTVFRLSTKLLYYCNHFLFYVSERMKKSKMHCEKPRRSEQKPKHWKVSSRNIMRKWLQKTIYSMISSPT